MRIYENKRIDRDEMRKLCIQNSFYTSGTNDEYERMLITCESTKQVTPESLFTIAIDIAVHTPRYCQMDNDIITGIMYLINKHAVITEYEIE